MQEPHPQAASHRWATRLTLDAIGLKVAKAIFAPPNAVEVQELNLGHTAVPVVMSAALDVAASWSEAFDVGQRLIMTISAILFTRDPRRHAPNPEIQEIYRWRPDGVWEVRQSVRPSGPGRAARSATFVRPGDAEPNIQMRPIKGRLLAVVETDEVAEVLHSLRGNPDWFDLWKATEPIDRHWKNLPRDVQSPENWVELQRVRASSTFHRHTPASPHWNTAGKRLEKLRVTQMDIVEASRAVAHLVGLWLDWKADVYRRKRRS